MTALDGWENFYVIVGSSAGALIGLQFVVLALIAEAPIARRDAQAGDAFTTPSVVHFGVVLFLSAIVSALRHGIGKIAILWGLMGFGGMIYSIIVTRALAGANHLQARVRGSVVSCSASIGGLRSNGCVRVRGLLSRASGSFPRRRVGVDAALHWHSQCLGHRHVSRLCQETGTAVSLANRGQANLDLEQIV
jgi:hypothetical protein